MLLTDNRMMGCVQVQSWTGRPLVLLCKCGIFLSKLHCRVSFDVPLRWINTLLSVVWIDRPMILT